jgi:uncharacterized membrane protein
VALLVLVHVLAAVIGVGPTYCFPILLRPSLTPPELRTALGIAQRLARFPQIGGPIALLSGIALVFAMDPAHLLVQKWIIGSMVLFVAIQVVVMTMAVPATKRLAAWAFNPANVDAKVLPPEAEAHFRKLRMAHATASACGTLLFTLMILKPV